MTDILKQQISGLIDACNSRYATYDGQLDALELEAKQNADAMASFIGMIEDALDEDALYTRQQVMDLWGLSQNQYLFLSDGSYIKASDLADNIIIGRNTAISSGKELSNVDQVISFYTHSGSKSYTLNEICHDINDQYNDCVIRCQAIRASLRGEIDEENEIIKADVAGFASLLNASLDVTEERTKDIISYYADAISKPCDKYTLLSRLKVVYNNFTLANETSTGFTYTKGDSSYTGSTSFSVWLSSIGWPDEWSATAVIQGAKAIIKAWWKLATGQMGFQKKGRSWLKKKFLKPFKKPTELFVEKNSYTTNFVDLPVFQVTSNGIYGQEWIFDLIPEDKILVFEVGGVRIAMWRYVGDDTYTHCACQVNVSPVAPDISSISLPVAIRDGQGNYTFSGNYTDLIFSPKLGQLPLESKSDYRRGICTNLFLADLYITLILESIKDSSTIDAEIADPNSVQSPVLPYFVQGVSSSPSTRSASTSSPSVLNGNLSWFTYIGNITSTATPDNQDIYKYIAGGSNNAKLNGEVIEGFTPLALSDDEPTKIMRKLIECLHYANNNDVNDYGLVYYYADSLGTPRFMLASDPTAGAFELWLVEVAVIVAAVIVIAKAPKMLAKRRTRKARIESDEWRCMSLLSENSPGSTEYNQGLELYNKVCKRRFIAGLFSSAGSNSSAAAGTVSSYFRSKSNDDVITITNNTSSSSSNAIRSINENTLTSVDQIKRLIK